MLLSVAEWDDDGDLVWGGTILGGMATTQLHLRVLLCQELQVHMDVKVNRPGAN